MAMANRERAYPAAAIALPQHTITTQITTYTATDY
jgi:hypothetical protein